jgi:hypothetical protein
MRFSTVATLVASAAIAAGCGGDDSSEGNGSGATESEPKEEIQISEAELRECLKKEGTPDFGGGGLSGKGVEGKIPLVIVGTNLQTATNLLVFPDADAAQSFVDDPPPAASFITVIGRTGNIVRAQASQPTGDPAAPPAKVEAAIDTCLSGA